MPEGDSVAAYARRLRDVLVAREVEEVRGTAGSVRSRSDRILASTVDGIRTFGKHLVIDLSSGYSIRVHLGMSGRWRITNAKVGPHGSARLVLGTSSHRAVCYAAPTVEVDRTAAIDAGLRHLGPDLLGDFDEDEMLRGARASRATISSMLLNQQVMAGIGNVYKSELMFLERLHPETPVSNLDDERLRSLARRARRLMAANIGSGGRRVTTGSAVIGRELWVYGQNGRPCRRCGTRIEQARLDDRITYWCPSCQPPGAGF